MLIDDGTDGLSGIVIGVAIEIHKKYGPGLLENAYHQPLVWALEKRGLKVETEVPLSLEFEGQVVPRAYVQDIVVERKLLLELKSVAMLLPIHLAQVTTYLSLSDLKLALLINFNVPVLRYGIRRVLHPGIRRSPHASPSAASHSTDSKGTKRPEGAQSLVVEGDQDDRLVKRPRGTFVRSFDDPSKQIWVPSTSFDLFTSFE